MTPQLRPRLRLVNNGDLDALLNLAHQSGHGLTSLAADRDSLAERIEKSRSGKSRLFVLEEPENQRVVGSSGITCQVGIGEPWYSYRKETLTHHSQGLGITHNVEVLHRKLFYNGPTEVGTLFLSPSARGGGTGRFLSLARFLYVAQFPDQFQPEVFAEMRGVSDAAGRSPFWDAVGRHFYTLDYSDADFRSAHDKQFIAELMPRHPIYLTLLPDAATSVVGKAHPDTQPALHLLMQEGFQHGDLVDIFDAGPIVTCPTQQIRTVRDSRIWRWTTDVPADANELWMIGNTRDTFLATFAPARPEGDTLQIPHDVAATLDLESGEPIRAVRLRPDYNNES
ncbi:arginine N-succinyltransferase [Mucisphaera calidilacus]|uniref:Arginine N-succinyltransferase n=1 Tax=Mucisphaera calidilacus TaxID=2527982 RepID=A0A518BXK4_9BACT|nr:arginine N-succinyltransferase [Mucisphaera calidilacus]QDU71709.1 Arginine N-succinyltransferase [Mucisphaera calidilacus]